MDISEPLWMAADEPQCWGGVLKADGGQGCDPLFSRGRRHMKNKFCTQCNGKRGELYLPLTRVRGVPESLHDVLVNSSDGGVWSRAPNVFGNVSFRLINNTVGCSLPRIIIFEQESPALPGEAEWVALPDEWKLGEYLHVYVSRGTLVPAFDRKRPRGMLSSSSCLSTGSAPMPAPGFNSGGLALYSTSFQPTAPEQLAAAGAAPAGAGTTNEHHDDPTQATTMLHPHPTTVGQVGQVCQMSQSSQPRMLHVVQPALNQMAPPGMVQQHPLANRALPQPFPPASMPPRTPTSAPTNVATTHTSAAAWGDSRLTDPLLKLSDEDSLRVEQFFEELPEPADSSAAGSEQMLPPPDKPTRGIKRPTSKHARTHGGERSVSFYSNDSADGSSRGEGSSNDSGSFGNGAYLLSKFSSFCSKLVRKRRAKKMMAAEPTSAPPPVQPLVQQLVSTPIQTTSFEDKSREDVDQLRLSILAKFDSLLAHGDDKQLARIEASLAELHLAQIGNQGPAAGAGAAVPPSIEAPGVQLQSDAR